MPVITTPRNNRINTDMIEYFAIEQYANGDVALRAKGTRNNGGVLDQLVTPRMSRFDVFGVAESIKPGAPIMRNERGAYVPYQLSYADRKYGGR